MSILEQVARAICEADTEAPEPDAKIYIGMKTAKAWEGRTDMATAAITAFLEAIAKLDKGGRTWRMVPDEATEDMDEAGLDDPHGGYCDRCMHLGHARNSGWPSVIYEAMLEAAPPFKLDGETT